MVYVAGLVLFALGIVLSLALHEAGHLLTARAFGMKVTRFFIGYGPTLWSFRRGETEYGVKAIPAGAFVRIVGMTPDDEVDPRDEHRAMWRFPVWKRTVVMAAGAMTHFVLGVLILWGLFAFTPLEDPSRLEREPVRVATVSAESAATRLGLRPGDVITAVDGAPVQGWNALRDKIRASGGREIAVTVQRDGQTLTSSVVLPEVNGVGVIGVAPVVPKSTAGPVDGFGLAIQQTGLMFQNTFESLKRLPQKIPALVASIFGAERDPQTPVSLVGASHIGGVLFDRGELVGFVLLLAALNFFVGVFNLLPVPPADGGHIAIYWFERARSWYYARLRRPDPGPVDYYRLAPVMYVAIAIFASYTVLTVVADLVNPVSIPS